MVGSEKRYNACKLLHMLGVQRYGEKVGKKRPNELAHELSDAWYLPILSCILSLQYTVYPTNPFSGKLRVISFFQEITFFLSFSWVAGRHICRDNAQNTRLTVGILQLTAEVTHYVIPSKEDSAFLQAKVSIDSPGQGEGRASEQKSTSLRA